MSIAEPEKGDPKDFKPAGKLQRDDETFEKKVESEFCFNCVRKRRLSNGRSEEPSFFSSVTQWKDLVPPESNRTKEVHILYNADFNSFSSESELSYCCQALDPARSTISYDVTNNSTRREATCILSRDTANYLSEVKMASTRCRSCREISYRDVEPHLAKRILPTKKSQESALTNSTEAPCKVTRSKNPSSGKRAQASQPSQSSSTIFKSLTSTFDGLIFLFVQLYEVLLNISLDKLRSSKPRSMQTYKSAKVSNLLAFIALISLIATSVASGAFTGSRHHFRGEFRNRHPRQSGFRRASAERNHGRCEPITVPECKNIGYNKTDMSLSIMKSSQSEAASDLKMFAPLVRVNCSSELKLFLCSIYTPICMEAYPKFLPPCRFVCERVRSGCLPIMEKYKYDWPESLKCEQFPEYAVGKAMCMHFNLTRSKEELNKSREHHRPSSTVKPSKSTTRSTTKATTTTTISQTTAAKLTSKSVVQKDEQPGQFDNTKDNSRDGEISKNSPNLPSTNWTQSSCLCRAPMVVIVDPADALYNRVTTGRIPNCAISCKSPYFTDEEISIAEIWIKSWSIVCFVVTLMTVSTFLIDMERFKYPERPIIFLSTCYMFVSVGFLIRIISGHEAVACAYRTDHVLYHTTGPLLCTTVFLLVYFFSMASALWWVILSMTWFLAAGLKWGSEAIEKYSQYYHAVAWLIPSLQTIMVLAMSSVDGDSLSGICFVGNQDVRALRGFVLAPLVVYLALGGMFLLAGFISLFRIRSRIKKEGTKTKKLEKLMGRIGIFSVLYMVPAAALVACYFYEQQYRPFWEYSHNCLPPDKTTASYPMFAPMKPEFLVPMVRYLMTLLIGVTNGVWICSSKTLDSWSRFYTNHGPCHKSTQKDVEESSSCQDEHKPGRRNGRNSMVHGEQDTDNRSDSYQARYHDKSVQREASSRAESANSRRTRSSGSNEQSSRAPSRGRCEACERSSRCSTQNVSGADGHRKRRRTRSGSSKSSRTESSRKRQTACEAKSNECDILCENNTTSTDGSDRPSADNKQSGCGSDAVSNPSRTSVRDDQSGPSRNRHVLLEASTRQSSTCHFCDESRQNCFTLGGHYAINFNDNLPPCPARPCQSMVPHEHGVGKSASTLPTSDCDDEVQASLLSTDSCYPYDLHRPNSPYYHYHHHHYHGGIR